MGIGERINAARTAKGLSVEALAKMVGVNRSAVHRWEADERTPRIEYIFRLSVVLDIDVNDLVGTRKATRAEIAQ